MGYVCNEADLSRFMRSKEGQEVLEEMRQKLEGAKIKSVSFSNEADFISLTLKIEGGESIMLLPPELDVDVVRKFYPDLLEREYYIDHPERKPTPTPKIP